MLTIIIPTLNEEKNIAKLLDELKTCFSKIATVDVVISDGGSTDATVRLVREYASLNLPANEENMGFRVSVKENPGSSLARSVFFVMNEISSPYFLVMDGDGQHLAADAVGLYRTLVASNCDLVIGTRPLNEMRLSSDHQSLSRGRKICSEALNWMVQKKLKIRTADPLSGFFCGRRSRINMNQLVYADGFKILLEILMRNPGIETEDVQIYFGPRVHGKSKLGIKNVMHFFSQVASYITGNLVTPRFFAFCFIGSMILCVHILLYSMAAYITNMPSLSHGLAIALSSMLSFQINNVLTFDAIPRRIESPFTATLVYCILSALMVLPNILIFDLMIEQFNYFNTIIISLLSLPFDTIVKFILVRKIIWR
jgi:glycosyltransferase involved in cell wall biosynthesis